MWRPILGLAAAGTVALMMSACHVAAADHAAAVTPPPVSAGEIASPPSAFPSNGAVALPQASAAPGLLDRFNGTMHDFNLWVWTGVEAAGDWTRPLTPPQSVRAGLSNLLSNLINEPTAAMSWVVAGDYGNAQTALHRLWINTTQGWLGVEDVASQQGVVAPAIDIGLALCARGVSEGAYVVLPLVGPRTVRDGLSDFLLVNTITYLLLAPVIGFPPSLQSVATVEVLEEGGRVAVMRQIDHADDLNPSADAVREEYLAFRRARCAQIISMLHAKGLAP